jgi:hypothetical protein
MAVARKKMHNVKCQECSQTPDAHTIKMKKPHGFKLPN